MDEAVLQRIDLVCSELESIYVMDRFNKRTSEVFSRKDAPIAFL